MNLFDRNAFSCWRQQCTYKMKNKKIRNKKKATHVGTEQNSRKKQK
jgi:hypothetical protein